MIIDYNIIHTDKITSKKGVFYKYHLLTDDCSYCNRYFTDEDLGDFARIRVYEDRFGNVAEILERKERK